MTSTKDMKRIKKELEGNNKSSTDITNFNEDDLELHTSATAEDIEINNSLIQTPMDPPSLVLNPGWEEHPKNPLCPECKEEIIPLKNHTERRFVCGCDTPWQFKFGEGFESDEDEPSDSSIKKNKGEQTWKPWEDSDE